MAARKTTTRKRTARKKTVRRKKATGARGRLAARVAAFEAELPGSLAAFQRRVTQAITLSAGIKG